MSIGVCVKCGYQVDLDFHCETVTETEHGMLCEACADEEPDVVASSAMNGNWYIPPAWVALFPEADDASK